MNVGDYRGLALHNNPLSFGGAEWEAGNWVAELVSEGVAPSMPPPIGEFMVRFVLWWRLRGIYTFHDV